MAKENISKNNILHLKEWLAKYLFKVKPFMYLLHGYKLTIKLFKKSTYILEIHAADHCNLNCHGCYHFAPVADRSFINIDNLKRDLDMLIKVKNIFSLINILGGEPLLNPNLSQILNIVRDAFPKCNIYITTNGTLIETMPDSFWELVNKLKIKIRLTIYPNINYEGAKSLMDKKNVDYQVFGVRDNSWIQALINPNGKDKLFNFLQCDGGQFCWQLSDGRIYLCATSAYSKFLNKRFGTDFNPGKSDYLLLDKKISKFQLMKFALRPKDFCKYCVFPRKIIEWKPSQRKSEEWIQM